MYGDWSKTLIPARPCCLTITNTLARAKAARERKRRERDEARGLGAIAVDRVSGPMPCFVCGDKTGGGAYRIGGPGIVLVWLCEECGASLEAVMLAWLDRQQARPRQLSLIE